MEKSKKLPIEITQQTRDNPYIMSRLAKEAFQLQSYDMTPDNAVEKALQRGHIRVVPIEGTNPPIKIKRMSGHGSFV